MERIEKSPIEKESKLYINCDEIVKPHKQLKSVKRRTTTIRKQCHIDNMVCLEIPFVQILLDFFFFKKKIHPLNILFL